MFPVGGAIGPNDGGVQAILDKLPVKSVNFNFRATVHHYPEPRGFGAAGGRIVADAQLHPDGLDAFSLASAMASSVITPAASEFRKISTMSIVPGISVILAYTVSANRWYRRPPG